MDLGIIEPGGEQLFLFGGSLCGLFCHKKESHRKGCGGEGDRDDTTGFFLVVTITIGDEDDATQREEEVVTPLLCFVFGTSGLLLFLLVVAWPITGKLGSNLCSQRFRFALKTTSLTVRDEVGRDDNDDCLSECS